MLPTQAGTPPVLAPPLAKLEVEAAAPLTHKAVAVPFVSPLHILLLLALIVPKPKPSVEFDVLCELAVRVLITPWRPLVSLVFRAETTKTI
jgi:hypothetical protein